MKELYWIWVLSKLAIVNYVLLGVSVFALFSLFFWCAVEGFDEVDKRVYKWIKIIAVYTVICLLTTVLLPSPSNLRNLQKTYKIELEM